MDKKTSWKRHCYLIANLRGEDDTVKRLMLLIFVLSAACCCAQAASLSYIDLVRQLTDLEALSVLPEAGELCAQFSSYDRASRFDETSGKYVAWDANGDGRGIIREENGLQVLAEMEGPGCIRRIWSAAPGDGRVKIYLDGAPEPVLDMPFKEYFNLNNKPFNYPSLVHVVASGWNNYVPIPYQKSCKIVAEKNWGNYYHFTYTTFPKGTSVPTFKPELSGLELAALATADRLLTQELGLDPAPARKGQTRIERTISIPAGKSVVLKLEGPRAITALKIKPGNFDAKAAWHLLRQVTISIKWDGERLPSVWCPIGDFFGTAPGINEYKSLPLGMTTDGFYSYWYMPFEKSAVIEFANESGQSVTFDTIIMHAPIEREVRGLGRFHAKWHRDAFLPKEPERWIDWPMLVTKGRGRFCGVSLHVFNPKGGWWGEGDEKFWVDGEKFPSTFGTGSEDYFGYAWGNPTLFQNCFHNQTYNQISNAGNVSVNRWHIADNVPFQTSFEADIEKYFLNDRPTLYACTVYWYQAPGKQDPYPPVPVTERVGYYEYKIPKVEGVIEGEDLRVLSKTGGKVQKQELGGWSDNAQLWWTGAKPGDILELAFPVKKSGRFDVKVQLTKAHDYGIVQFYLDGCKVGNTFDLYEGSLDRTEEILIDSTELKAGEHKLAIEIIGANEKAIQSYMFGLDYVRVQRRK